MNIQTVSTKELRENFAAVRARVESGESLVLLYRSKPLAEIRPVRRKARGRTFTQKQLRQWIADDQLTEDERKRIDTIINRLS